MIRSRKVGGIRFLRIGRLHFSFCVSKRAAAATDRELSLAAYAGAALCALALVLA